ncbi:MAG TPA: nucleotidyltransferase family protein [Pyrinomonadaceae bacterium]|nr:nucleotidyltransferase family protein [Pyrinomonadaceae bacterium]
MNDAVRTEINDEARWNLLQKKTQEIRVVQAFELFRKNGIEPILIKGYAAARNYPESETRLSIDIDFAVAAADFDRAREIKAPEGIGIDVHRELRHLDTLPWEDLFGNSQMIEVDSCRARVLRDEDHLRVLCVHWLTDGGSDKSRLWDIYYAVANRPPDFDWGRFLDVVTPRRRRWLVATVGLARRYLGLDVSGTPIDAEARHLPKWLEKTVEREWAAETKTRPMEAVVLEPAMFVKQFVKRLRPNAIRATVEAEGDFEARTRVHYQIRNFVSRIKPTVRRIVETVRGLSRER